MVPDKWLRLPVDHVAAEQGYWFDEKAGLKVVAFFEQVLKHSQGDWAGKPFILEPWERDLIMRLYGWMRPNSHKRRFRQAYVEIPKKNGKTSLAAGLCLFSMVEERGAVVCQAARDVQQGKIVHEECRRMIKHSPCLKKYLKVNRSNNTIEYPANDAILHLLSSEAKSADGKNSSMTVLDELHQFDDEKMYRVLEYAGRARSQPLMVSITTAGDDRYSICYKIHEIARDILDGATHNLEFLPLIYATEEGDDLDDPEVWKKANPSLGTIIDIETFANEYRQAKRIPSALNYFKRTGFNIWTFGDSKWLNIKDWDACADRRELDWYVGRPTYVAIDLSSVKDLTAMSLISIDGNVAQLYSIYWMPMQTIKERAEEDRVPYDQWVAEGHMIGTDTPATDFDAIVVEIEKLRKLGIDIRVIGFDDWNAKSLRQDLEKAGFTVQAIGQSIGSYTGPTKELERRVLGRTLAHSANPVTRYCVTNVVVEQDALENIRPSKNKSKKGRIDGVVAAIMALGLTHIDTILTPGIH